MRLQVALVKVDSRYWLDRRIASMGGGQKYSHGAFVVEDNGKRTWWDMHRRWFKSDLRKFPANNYAWDYGLFDIPDLLLVEAESIVHWLEEKYKKGVEYDALQALGMFLADKLGWKKSPLGRDDSYQCFELILRGLQYVGRNLDIDPSMVLASDLLKGGLIFH